MARTIDSLISYFNNAVTEQLPLSPASWVEAAQYIVVLIEGEHKKLFLLQQEVAKEKVRFIEAGDSVAMAKAKVEATDPYREYLTQKARIEQLWEFVRTAKLRARLEQESFKNQ